MYLANDEGNLEVRVLLELVLHQRPQRRAERRNNYIESSLAKKDNICSKILPLEQIHLASAKIEHDERWGKLIRPNAIFTHLTT